MRRCQFQFLLPETMQHCPPILHHNSLHSARAVPRQYHKWRHTKSCFHEAGRNPTKSVPSKVPAGQRS